MVEWKSVATHQQWKDYLKTSEESKELLILASTNVMERIAIDTIGPAMLDWISQFGCPSEIVSDNGTQFVNKR